MRIYTIIYVILFSALVNTYEAKSQNVQGYKIIEIDLDNKCYTIEKTNDNNKITTNRPPNKDTESIEINSFEVPTDGNAGNLNLIWIIKQDTTASSIVSNTLITPNDNPIIRLAKEPITKCKQPDGNNRPKCSYFTISRVEKGALKNAIPPAPFKCNNVQPPVDQGLAVVYNFRDKCFCYFRDGKSISTVMPEVDELLHISVVNYQPYKDNVSFTYNFGQRNMEHGTRFASLMDGSPPKTTSDANPDHGGGVVADPQNNEEPSVKDTIRCFAEEMKALYNQLILDTDLSLELVQIYVSMIQAKMQEYWKTSNPEQLRESLSQKIGGDPQALAILDEGLLYYKYLTNYKVLRFDPIQILNSDITTITMGTYSQGQPNPVSSSTYSYFNKSGFKIDFSSGLAFNGLLDHTYASMEDPNDSSKKIIAREDSDKFTVTPVILSHAYFRRRPRLNWGFTLGLSVGQSDNDLRLRYMSGVSLILGSEQRLVISTGAITGKVNRLANGLNVGDNFSASSSNPPNINTYRVSWFLGITYNFGSLSIK